MSQQETKPQEAGFRLRGKFYPYATTERLPDAPLIELVCGIKSQEWRRRYIEELQRAVEAKEEGKEIDDPDEIVSLGNIAVAISRGHPTWSRSRVADFIKDLDWEELETVNPVVELVEEEMSPPADGTPGEKITSQSSETSKSESEPASEISVIHPTSGPLTSPTSPKAPSHLVT